MTSARHLSLVTCHCPCHLPAGAPAPLFLSFGLREPRGSVRLGLGGRFPRASRFNFLRSALSLIFLVFIIRDPHELLYSAHKLQRRSKPPVEGSADRRSQTTATAESERPVARFQAFSRGANFSMSFLI